MIKVLSGKYKGRKLSTFNLSSIRPTQARIKKSMMDTLMPFENKTILDLFSGVGTLGIEAMSRGASFVCFIDSNPKAINILKKNINMLNLEDEVKIKLFDVFKFLKNTDLKFDIILADPPYYKYDFEYMRLLIKPILESGGTFCYESNKQEVNDTSDLKIKEYGNTQLTFWSKT